LSEEGRAEDADGRGVAGVVEDVLGRDAEAPGVPALDLLLFRLGGLLRGRRRSDGGGLGVLWGGCCFGGCRRLRDCRAEVEGAAEAEVDDEDAGAGAVVDRDDFLTGEGIGVEDAPLGVDDAGAGEVGGEGGAVVELGVAVDVVAEGDIEWLKRQGSRV
jgi:hypothetical protein